MCSDAFLLVVLYVDFFQKKSIESHAHDFQKQILFEKRILCAHYFRKRTLRLFEYFILWNSWLEVRNAANTCMPNILIRHPRELGTEFGKSRRCRLRNCDHLAWIEEVILHWRETSFRGLWQETEWVELGLAKLANRIKRMTFRLTGWNSRLRRKFAIEEQA